MFISAMLGQLLPIHAEQTAAAYPNQLAFAIKTLDQSVDPWSTSIALDSGNRPHIVYSKGGIIHTFNNGSSWIFETVETGTTYYSDFTLDSNGYPHISYSVTYAADANQLKYAYFNGSFWTVQTVATVQAAATYIHPSIDVDSRKYPHISYLDFDYKTSSPILYYTYYNGSLWLNQTVDSGNIVWAPSMA